MFDGGQDLGDVVVSLHLGKRTPEGVYVRRASGDGGAFVAPAALVDLIARGAWQFRAKRVFPFRPRDLSPTKIERALRLSISTWRSGRSSTMSTVAALRTGTEAGS